MRCSVRECLLDTYEAFDCQTSATDAAGVTTFTYDPYGQLISEQVSGLYSKTLTRHYDAFGRNVGYSVDNERKQSIVYAPATGRISESDGFKWTYLPGTNLKSSLTYPNEDVVTWTYEPHRDLLTAVTNATYSTYVYTNDLLGRRTSKNDEQYGYNVRDELISANEVSYAYDDIGNRTIAEGKTYTANNLNQYTKIDGFVPEYDADGNQTLIQTETSVWSVVYNAENRPIRWESGDTVITMAFDRMGRRVEMRTQSADSDLLQRFAYDNYLCVQQLRGTENILFQSYVWDPTEPIATRPLVFLPTSGEVAYYFHDGNKNVSDLVDVQENVSHYAYTPFGKITRSDFSENPYRFSSEYFDILLGQPYYNFRHYSPNIGRWSTRDIFGEVYVSNLYSFLSNSPSCVIDFLGLTTIIVHGTWADDEKWWTSTGDYVSELRKYLIDDIHNWNGWRGNNDHSARVEGAQLLLNEILELCKGSQDRPINIIAHSHGGNVVWLMLERLATECPCCEIGTIILLGVPNMGIPQDDGTLAYIYATQGAADVANYIINVSSTNDWTQTGFANWANGIDGDEIEGRGIPVGWRDTVSISRENPFAHQNYPNSTSKSQTEGASGHSDLHAPGFANEHAEWINSRIPLLRPLVRQYLKQEKK